MYYAYLFYFGSFLTSLINPFWGLVGLVVSVLIRFQDRFPEIAIIKPFSLLFIGLVIGCLGNREKLSKNYWQQDKLLILLLVTSVFGLLIMEPGDLFSQTWQFVSSLAFYYFASRIIQTTKQMVIIFAVMSCCTVFMGYEVIQDVLANPETSIFIDPRSGRWQGLGYYQNANEFGQIMVTTVPFLLAAILMKNNIIIKTLAVLFIVILAYVVGNTGSRTVMVLLGLMLVLTFVLRGSGNIIQKSFVGGIVGIVLLFGLSFAPGPIQDRLQTITGAGTDKSFQGRTRAWDQGFKMVSWYPITGVGKGQWIEYHGLMPHNSYVQIMAELGPFGIFLFLWILRLSYKEFIPYFNHNRTTSNGDPPAERSPSSTETEHPIWGVSSEEIKTEVPSGVPEVKIDDSNETKTVVIAVAVVMIGWLIYIFLGNQGYSVWTYFYIGICAAVKNFGQSEHSPLTSKTTGIE